MPDDAATLAAIDRVDRSVQSLRTDLSLRVDQMVTRKEHESEVRRLDAEAQATRKALADHETEAGKRLDGISEQIADGEKRRQDAKNAAEAQRKADRRWLIGIVLTAIAVAASVSGVIAAVFGA